MAHIDPLGVVPSDSSVGVNACELPFLHTIRDSLVKSRGVSWKQASVTFTPGSYLHNLYEYPPPWLALTYHVGLPSPPRFHTTPVGRYGRTTLPLSPSLAYIVVLKSPPSVCANHVPPPKPHASETGAFPGARQGKYRVPSYVYSCGQDVVWLYCVCVCVHVQKICTEINNEELLYSTKHRAKKEAIYELRQEGGVRMLSQLVIGDRKLATC